MQTIDDIYFWLYFSLVKCVSGKDTYIFITILVIASQANIRLVGNKFHSFRQGFQVMEKIKYLSCLLLEATIGHIFGA